MDEILEEVEDEGPIPRLFQRLLFCARSLLVMFSVSRFWRSEGTKPACNAKSE